jgi:hypothetical protein
MRQWLLSQPREPVRDVRQLGLLGFWDLLRLSITGFVLGKEGKLSSELNRSHKQGFVSASPGVNGE